MHHITHAHSSPLAQRAPSPGTSVLARLWQIDRTLTGSSVLMLCALAVAAAGLWLDPRTITGAPAWLKPAKFAISTAIYGFTLTWIFAYLPDWPRLRRVAGRTTAAMFVLEVGIIFVQAWRGTTSHFNVGAPLDAALFGVMGLGILAQTGVAAAVAVALWRQRFADRAMGWAFRLGLTISVLGSATGGLMTMPTTQQLAHVRETGSMPLSGAHTVGAPDGGPGIPGTAWSIDHGDIRVPHFFGLHAMQALPLLALALRRRHEAIQVRLVMIGAVGYLSLFALLLWQALRGESFVNPGATTTAAFVVVAVLVAAGAALSALRAPAARTHAITL